MSEPGDAFGNSMWDYYRGCGGREVVERSDGLIDPSEVAPKLYFAPFGEWPEVERKAIGYAKGVVLDVGCGAGRVSLHLQEKGCDVVGIDTSPLAVKICRLRGVKKAKLMPIQKVDFAPGSFDSVVMFGNNFGLLGSRSGAKMILRRLWRMTSEGATLIGESVDPYETANPDHLEYQRANRAKGRMPGQVRIRIRYRTFVGRWFDYLLVSQDEMKGLVDGTGWRVQRFVTSKGSPLYAGILKRS